MTEQLDDQVIEVSKAPKRALQRLDGIISDDIARTNSNVSSLTGISPEVDRSKQLRAFLIREVRQLSSTTSSCSAYIISKSECSFNCYVRNSILLFISLILINTFSINFSAFANSMNQSQLSDHRILSRAISEELLEVLDLDKFKIANEISLNVEFIDGYISKKSFNSKIISFNEKYDIKNKSIKMHVRDDVDNYRIYYFESNENLNDNYNLKYKIGNEKLYKNKSVSSLDDKKILEKDDGYVIYYQFFNEDSELVYISLQYWYKITNFFDRIFEDFSGNPDGDFGLEKTIKYYFPMRHLEIEERR